MFEHLKEGGRLVAELPSILRGMSALDMGMALGVAWAARCASRAGFTEKDFVQLAELAYRTWVEQDAKRGG